MDIDVGAIRKKIRVPCQVPSHQRAQLRIGGQRRALGRGGHQNVAVYAAAELKLAPWPSPPTPQMTTVPVFSNHNAIIRAERQKALAAHPLGVLVAGHKKDVVISARLANAPEKVAIYGWHKLDGKPIQPLTIVHNDTYVDYSHGIRLVKRELKVDGKTILLDDVLQDPHLNVLLSDEGTISDLRYPGP